MLLRLCGDRTVSPLPFAADLRHKKKCTMHFAQHRTTHQALKSNACKTLNYSHHKKIDSRGTVWPVLSPCTAKIRGLYETVVQKTQTFHCRVTEKSKEPMYNIKTHEKKQTHTDHCPNTYGPRCTCHPFCTKAFGWNENSETGDKQAMPPLIYHSANPPQENGKSVQQTDAWVCQTTVFRNTTKTVWGSRAAAVSQHNVTNTTSGLLLWHLYLRMLDQVLNIKNTCLFSNC